MGQVLWFLLLVVVVATLLAVMATARRRRAFDDTGAPADDLRRADDGHRPGLAERDGTGGLI